MLSSETSSVSGFVLGVDPTLEHRMVSQPYPGARQTAAMIEGEDLDPKDPQGIVLGEGLTKALGLGLGTTASLITTRSSGAIDGAEFHVRGSLITPLKEVGERVMKINLQTARSLLDLPNQVHYLLVILKDTKDTQRVKHLLEKKFKSENLNLEIVTWEEQGTLYKQSRNFLAGINRVVQIIVSIIFFLSIANTINMALFERMREYGTMMAIGNSRLTVFSVIFLEACILGLIGSCIGVLTGIGAANLLGATGLEIPPPPITTVSIGSLNLLFLISPCLLLEAFLISFVATIASSIIPGYRASHLKIVQALGYI
jgi:putative ABC transport system permease protein